MGSRGTLPSPLAASRISARGLLAIAGGIGCAASAYAGLYPRFDGGSLRLVLALTSAPFGAAVVAAALGARSAARAFGRTLFLAALLGTASIVLPVAILAWTKGPGVNFGACIIVGFCFGAPTGALYGLPLGILSAIGHGHVQTATHECTDHAARVSGVWLFLIGMLGLVATLALDSPTTDFTAEGQPLIPMPRVPAVVAGAAALVGLGIFAHAVWRQRRRAAWLGRVRQGLEPAFRLRLADVRDHVEGLPRVSDGGTVVEWLPDEIGATTAYRMSASGIAIAVIDGRPGTD